jgi:ribonuclease P protein component
MSRFSFPKCERLAKRPQFEVVMAKGRRKRVNTICTLFMLPNDLGRKRLGIIASKKIGNAVIRNRAKRKIREAFRRIKDRIGPGMDIVIISGKDLVALSVCTLEEKLSKSLLNQQ